jgi:UDP-GlcNAc:undecaprenyl-phosphate/decaprenyl-phosphate GlcNAc-1-phosphate transferase
MQFLLPFFITLLITPVITHFAILYNIADRPNGDALKIHKKPIALLGGAGIFLAFFNTMFFVFIATQANSYIISNLQLTIVILSAFIMFLLGLIDDLMTIKPIIRLILHIFVGSFLFFSGIKVNFIPFIYVAWPLTIFYISGAVNSFNVTDGMDGLCSGIAMISAIGFYLLGIIDGNAFLSILSIVLFMSLLGFLPYNFFPASIFLGDGGAYLIGYLIGLMAIISTKEAYSFVGLIIPILLIGIPVFDMAFAITRRLLNKKHPFYGDRDHFYDLLLKKGWGQKKVWSISCLMQMAFVATAILLKYFSK